MFSRSEKERFTENASPEHISESSYQPIIVVECEKVEFTADRESLLVDLDEESGRIPASHGNLAAEAGSDGRPTGEMVPAGTA